VVFLEHEGLYNSKGEVPEDPEFLVPFGRANILREGSDITIVAYAKMTMLALQAAAELEKEGVSCEVIDLRTLNPLDSETFIESARKTGRAVVVEECWRSAGLGGDLAHQIHQACFDSLRAPVRRVAGLDVPMPYSRQLEKLCIPQVDTITVAVREVILASV
jgi:pyruvate dehydrogenase E1 component beta subunit